MSTSTIRQPHCQGSNKVYPNLNVTTLKFTFNFDSFSIGFAVQEASEREAAVYRLKCQPVII